MVTVTVGVQDRPSTAPSAGAWESDYKLFASPSFAKAFSAISALIYSYAGTPGMYPLDSHCTVG
jgi:hypothetical protein